MSRGKPHGGDCYGLTVVGSDSRKLMPADLAIHPARALLYESGDITSHVS